LNATIVQAAQVASGIAATIGLFVVAWQQWRTRQVAVLQSLQEFIKSANERERVLRDDDDKRHALVEFMNFLEVYSAATNNGLLIGVAREFVVDKVVDSVVVLERASQWHDELARSVSSESTFKHLTKFMELHRAVIAGRRTASRNAR
jgi:hypothetical protein